MKIFRFFHNNKDDVSVITEEFDVEEYSRKYMNALNTPNPRYIAAKEKALLKALQEQGLLLKEDDVGIGLELKDGQEQGRANYDKLKESQDPNFTGGRKFDGGKLQYGLLPPLALREVVKVLTFGAEKYEPDNWKRVPDPNRRYFDAAQRHLWAYKEGEINDPESGVSHLAHALCCIMFMLDLDEEKK